MQEIPDYRIWLPLRKAAEKLGVSVDTIGRRAIPYQPEHVPLKIRYKMLLLNENESDPERRYLEEDLEAMLVVPPQLKRPGARKLFNK